MIVEKIKTEFGKVQRLNTYYSKNFVDWKYPCFLLTERYQVTIAPYVSRKLRFSIVSPFCWVGRVFNVREPRVPIINLTDCLGALICQTPITNKIVRNLFSLRKNRCICPNPHFLPGRTTDVISQHIKAAYWSRGIYGCVSAAKTYRW